MRHDTYWFEFVHAAYIDDQPPQAVGGDVADVMLFRYTEDWITRCFDGRTWLNQRFHPDRVLQVDVRSAEVDDVVIEESKPLMLRVTVPMAWPGAGSDGLIGLRATQLIMRVLAHVGQVHGLGPPPLRSAGAGIGKPDLDDPFDADDTRTEQDAQLIAWAQHHLAHHGHTRVLALAPLDAPKRLQQRATRVLNVIGATTALPVPDVLSKGVRAWTVQPPP